MPTETPSSTAVPSNPNIPPSRRLWSFGHHSRRTSHNSSQSGSRQSSHRASRQTSEKGKTANIRTPSNRHRNQRTGMSVVRRLLTGSANPSNASTRSRSVKSPDKQPTPAPLPPCARCSSADRKPQDLNRQIELILELSTRWASKGNKERLEECVTGDFKTLLKLFQIACDVQSIITVAPIRGPSMSQMTGQRLQAMAINVYGSNCTVTIMSNGAGVLFVVQREGVISLLFEGLHFDVSLGEETSIDIILQALLEKSIESDVDDLKALLSSIKWHITAEESDEIDDINAGGLDIPGLKMLRPEFFTTRVICMMLLTDVYENGFYKKYVHTDRIGTKFMAVREGETSVLSKISVMPDAVCRPVKTENDLLGEDLFMTRRKGRKDKFRLTCSVSVNVWEEYEAPEWFGYIHPPPNADAVRPSTLSDLKGRLEAYGIPDGNEVCRLVYHCLGHKPRNCNVKVDTLSATRSYFMYLKNFLRHGTTGGVANHVVEGEDLAVVYDGIAYRVNSPFTEMRHRSLFLSLIISDERERNGRNVPKRPVIRRMCSTSEVVLSICKDITYLNAEYDEDGGTLYSSSAEEENNVEAWATCIALFVCDGYGCLEGCFNCAIENRRGAIVDEMAVFMNDVQVPVVFDKLYKKTSIMDELSNMSEARGPTYPGAFISGKDQCNERTYLAGHNHHFVGSSLTKLLLREGFLTFDMGRNNFFDGTPSVYLGKHDDGEKKLIQYNRLDVGKKLLG